MVNKDGHRRFGSIRRLRSGRFQIRYPGPDGIGGGEHGRGVGADWIPVVSRADRAMFGYFASMLAAERVVADSGLPWTTLRATQFHEKILMTATQMAKLPVIPAPAGFRFQPVDAGEVADQLVELALGTPPGWCPI
jgi:hypothetical protein